MAIAPSSAWRCPCQYVITTLLVSSPHWRRIGPTLRCIGGSQLSSPQHLIVIPTKVSLRQCTRQHDGIAPSGWVEKPQEDALDSIGPGKRKPNAVSGRWTRPKLGRDCEGPVGPNSMAHALLLAASALVSRRSSDRDVEKSLDAADKIAIGLMGPIGLVGSKLANSARGDWLPPFADVAAGFGARAAGAGLGQQGGDLRLILRAVLRRRAISRASSSLSMLSRPENSVRRRDNGECVRASTDDQTVAEARVIPFAVIVRHELANRFPQRGFAEEDHAHQAGFLDAAYESFGMRIQIR